jgi:sugar phosphate isomerase/epimerase
MPSTTRPFDLTRRSFLELAAPLVLAAPLAACKHGAPATAAKAPTRTIPIAVQLYSVRGDCKTDFDAALAQVAKMGFAGVEFAGYYGYSDRPADLRKRLDALGLKAAGTHVAVETLKGDALKKSIDFHQAIGCRFLVVPSNADASNPEKSKAFADTMNGVAATLKPLGMACGFHNHAGEFKKDGEKTFWDLFAERTTKDVILQQDCGWTMTAGFDPVEYVKKYPGRSRTIHFKPTVRKDEAARKPIIGQDSVDWRGVYAACIAVGATEWVVVEQEYYPDGKSPMDCTRESLAGLKTLIG